MASAKDLAAGDFANPEHLECRALFADVDRTSAIRMFLSLGLADKIFNTIGYCGQTGS